MNKTEKLLRQIIREEIKRINEATLANDMYYRKLTKEAYSKLVDFVAKEDKNLGLMFRENKLTVPWKKGSKWPSKKKQSKNPKFTDNFIGVHGDEIFGKDQGGKISYGFAPYGGNVDGEEEKNPGGNGKTVAGFWTENAMFGGKQQGTIIMYVDGTKSVLKQLKDKNAQKTFQHEYQHFLDSAGDMKDVKSGLSRKHDDDDSYYNSAREFNTYYQEFQDQTGKFFATLAKGTREERLAVWLMISQTNSKRGQNFQNFIKILESKKHGPEYDEIETEWFASTMKHPKNRIRLIKRLQNLYEYFERGIDAPPKSGPLSNEEMEMVRILATSGRENLAYDMWIGKHPLDHPNLSHKFEHEIKWPAPNEKSLHDTRGK